MSDSTLDDALPRLIYLYSKFPITLPRPLLPFVPMRALLEAIPKGLTEAALVAQLPYSIVENFYLEGEDLGPGSESELRHMLAALIYEVIDGLEQQSQKIELLGMLQRFRQMEDLFQEQIIQLDKLHTPEVQALKASVQKWYSGFEPLDLVLDGILPHSLIVVMGRTQVGKTTSLIAILAAIKAEDPTRPVLFVENEIEASLMLWRYGEILESVEFGPGDRLICGSFTPSDLVEYVQDHPDPRRVVFFDSPDVMTATAANDKRHVLENHYINLVRVRSSSQAVFTTSQARRGDQDLQLDSAAEAWTKAWYADALVALQPAGRSPDGTNRLRIKGLKNRWGPGGRSYVYEFDYGTCDYGKILNDAQSKKKRRNGQEDDVELEDEEDTW